MCSKVQNVCQVKVLSDIASHRLYNQRIAQKKFERPGQTVAWFGAMQAQDYTIAKWTVGLRCCDTTEAIIERAIVNKYNICKPPTP